jgi:16S rRNA (uracil1498-N3)-methyltransferase
MLAHPGGKSLASVWPVGEPPHEPIVAAIGPEGGFADDEAQAALDAGWTPVDLGPLILRVETAAIALAAWAMLGRAR